MGSRKFGGIVVPLLVFVSAVIAGTTAHAQEEPVFFLGEGEAEIAEENIGKARRLAVDRALRDVIRQVVVVLLERVYPVDDGNDDLVRELFTRKTTYIATYEVLSEIRAETRYFISLKSTVFLSHIEQQLLETGLIRPEAQEETKVVEIVVLGLDGIESYTGFVSKLRESGPDVRAVIPRWIKIGCAILEVEYAGAIDGLVKDTTELGVDGRRVRLTKLGPGKLLAVLGGEKREASEKIIPRQ